MAERQPKRRRELEDVEITKVCSCLVHADLADNNYFEETHMDENMKGEIEVFLLKCVLLPSWRGDLGGSPSGRPPGSHAPTKMVAEPPARAGYKYWAPLRRVCSDH